MSFFWVCNAQAEAVKVPLSFLLPDGRTPILRGQWDKISFPLRILNNQQAEKIRISLALKQSKNILQTTLRLNLGDKPLATIQLEPSRTQKKIIAELTPEHLVQYGNQLILSANHRLPPTLNVTQKRVEASEAATEILLDQSFFELTYSEKPYNQTLSGFTQLIKSGQIHEHSIKLESALPGYSDTSLSIASLLVQGWTLRSCSDKYQFSYHPIHTYQENTTPNVRLIYGTQTQLQTNPTIPSQYLREIRGPFLALYRDKKQNSWLFIVSGRDESEVVNAAQHFATPGYELPKQAFTLVGSHQPQQKSKLTSNRRYPIGHFSTQQQFGDEPLTLPLLMPANILVNKEETAQLNLLLKHPKIIPGEAAMVVRINGDYANSTPLRASYWRDSQHYRLTFPMDKLQPGLNTLSIELYGPTQKISLTEKLRYQPFTASISPESNLKLGAWVTYLPSHKERVNAKELLVMATDNGRQSQLTLNYPEPSTLPEVWQLISHVSLNARQPMPELLLTKEPLQSRPLNLSFNIGNAYQQALSANNMKEVSYINLARQYILSKMNNSELFLTDSQPSQPISPFFQYDRNPVYSNHQTKISDTFGIISVEEESGWSEITFTATDNTQLKDKIDDYLNQPNLQHSGAIRQAMPNYQDDIQLVRAGFIYHPYLLPLLVFGLIVPLALFIHRRLGVKS
ncbi:cellulose biosynthesis cyclic di-GMP-binding regulatory protein BcsB [uncultured Photobacterium sp.]|uniref:cellulose biosynthesis cyclic di-GMP-binding regulatory protein BcsB n=1 Tax=uncultured Photobacterium sp. TaxID=173973 RepID=UPI002602D1D2|nr:cellulose biosynthesis cyclic di-GMP-binding regulatory protein BcsB [uncultured Photobacterium sp.]